MSTVGSGMSGGGVLSEEQLAAVVQVAADMALFSPCWCAAFLIAMSVMTFGDDDEVDGEQGMSATSAVWRRLREEWGQLYLGNLLVWIPANGVVYGLTPVEHRVAVFSAINIAYTAVLSLWAERERDIVV